jgi:hypothetical protein
MNAARFRIGAVQLNAALAVSSLAAALVVLALHAVPAKAQTHAQTQAQAQAQATKAGTSAPAATAASAPAVRRSQYRPESLTRGARNYYIATQGVDDLKVRRTNAGNLIRFSYRVVTPELARSLNDRQSKAVLIGHTSRAVLQVPTMDKVGPLRQATTPLAGREYWMVFSNKGDVVKAGERVSIVVGSFRAEGLLVE